MLRLLQTGADLIGALEAVKTLVPIISCQTGETTADDCKGSWIDSCGQALDALASFADHRYNFPQCPPSKDS